MIIKNLFLFIFLCLCGANVSSAHTLLYETWNEESNSVTGVYLNEKTSEVVVQKYKSLSDDQSLRNFNFPKTVNSFASFYHPTSRLRPDIKEEKVSLELNQTSPNLQVSIEKASGLSREDARKVLLDINQKVYSSGSNKVIKANDGDKNEFAIFSKSSGKLTFAKGRNSNLKLPESVSFPQDLIKSLSSKTTKVLDVSSPGNIEETLKKIKKYFKEFNFSNEQKQNIISQLNDRKKEFNDRISNMELIKSFTRNGVRNDLYFDFSDGSFYLKKSKKNKLIEDDFYYISDDKNLDDLKSKLERVGLYSDNEFDEVFDGLQAQSCDGLLELSDFLPDLDENISNILKVNSKLWGNYLENAVSDKVVVLADSSMVLSISALNDSHNIKIELDENGTISKADFLDSQKAKRDGLEIVKIVENGKEYFKVMSTDKLSGERNDQFFLDIEKGANGRDNLAVFVRGNSEGRDIYDKNTFELSLDGGSVVSAKRKVRSSTSRESAYPESFSKGSSQGVKSFFFNNFFSLESKREKLADEIRSAVNSQVDSINKDGNQYLDKLEINNIVLDIVRDVERDIPKLDASVGKLTAKTYEHAYKNFISNIVPKMIREMVPGESDQVYSDIALSSMEGLNKCLKLASDKRNEKAAEKCVDIYMKEAPIKIGEEVLKFQLSVNDQTVLSNTSVSEYNKCIKENYDPTENMSYIKGCIFKAMFIAVDKDLENVVGLSLTKMEDDFKKEGKIISLTADSKTFKKARNDLRNCYQEKGYIKPNMFSDNYNHNKLNSLGTDDFKNDLLGCSSTIEQRVGRSVAGDVLNYELVSMEVPLESRERIKEDTLSKGYDNCINIQNSISKRKEREGIFLKVEAAKCTDLVTLVATSEVITKTLKDKIGDELWDELLIKNRPPHLSCFENLNSDARDTIITGKAKNNLDELSAGCLKESVEWASYYLGKNELEKIFKSDPMYRKINLDEEKLNLYADKIKKCFSKNLAPLKSVSEVSSSLDSIQEKCTVELVMSDSAARDILIPVVSGILEDSEVDIGTVESTKEVIVSKMRDNVFNILKKRSLSLDEVVAEFKKIEGEATYIVANETIHNYVVEMVGDKSEDISEKLRDEVFNGHYGFKDKMLNAKDKDSLNNTIDEMTEVVAVKLTEHATISEGNKLLSRGVLKSEKDVSSMGRNAKNYMQSCLSKRESTQTVKERLEVCIPEVKSSVTFDVFDDQLKDILYVGDFSKTFSDSEKDEIYNKFINDGLRKDISKAYEDDDLQTLQSKFTLSATSTIGEGVLKDSISSIYTSNLEPMSVEYIRQAENARVVGDAANNVLQDCLDKQRGQKEVNTDSCINSARKEATSLIYKDKVKPFLSLLSKFPAEQDKFLNKMLSGFDECIESNSNKFNEYTDAVNSCLVDNIFGMVEDLITDSSERTSFVKSMNTEDFSKYRLCIDSKKRELIKDSKDLKNNKTKRGELYLKVGTGSDFWSDFFNSTESEDSQEKIDWAIESVQSCALSEAIPSVISAVSKSEGLRSKLSLTQSELAFTQDILKKIEDFSKDTFKNGMWINFEQASDKTKDAEQSELDTISNYLDQFMPQIAAYLKKMHQYDKEEATKAVEQLLEKIRTELKKNKELSVSELKDILMNSDLIDLVIMSEVSSFIATAAKEPLSKEGVNEEVIEKLSSKDILAPIFNKESGKKILSDIKEDFIAPMLNGKAPGEIPPVIVKDVKHLLASDTELGGFVETLSGAIVQKELINKKPNNFISGGIASLIGYESKDFDWNNLRSRTQPGVSKSEQPVNKAMNYFGEKILLPMLMEEDLGTKVEKGIFSNSAVDIMDERKEKFSGMIEDIMEL